MVSQKQRAATEFSRQIRSEVGEVFLQSHLVELPHISLTSRLYIVGGWCRRGAAGLYVFNFSLFYWDHSIQWAA